MPTFMKMVAQLEQPSEFLGCDVRAAALFGGIGFLVSLIALSTGEQGLWL